jgi:uncharacterized membrane protein
MKKYKLAIIIILALFILGFAFKLIYIKDGTINEGTYQVASITITKDTIQFHNIDLNKIYQAKQMEQYKKTHEISPELSYSEKEIDDYSNLNENFVNNAFPIPYEQAEDFKSGTFTYTYYLYPGNSIFGWLSYMILYIKRLK